MSARQSGVEVRSIDYVEKTTINGSTSHHLAARTDTVATQMLTWPLLPAPPAVLAYAT